MEANNETAILIGHIPADDFLRSYGARFQALMDRYQSVVRFGIYGHSHSEEFRLTSSVNLSGNLSDTKPIAVNTIYGPVTTYTGNNPSFGVYEMDEETMLPLNATTYYFDIVKANAGNP